MRALLREDRIRVERNVDGGRGGFVRKINGAAKGYLMGEGGVWGIRVARIGIMSAGWVKVDGFLAKDE